MTDEIVAFKGEIMLLSWSESHKAGRTGVILFDDEDPEHPMKKFTTKKGKRAGQRFACVLVELNDDETPVTQEKKGGPLSISAARMCENEEFQKFLARKHGVPWHEEMGNPEEFAAQYLREFCLIQSRAELDHNFAAAHRFHELMKSFNHGRAA